MSTHGWFVIFALAKRATCKIVISLTSNTQKTSACCARYATVPCHVAQRHCSRVYTSVVCKGPNLAPSSDKDLATEICQDAFLLRLHCISVYRHVNVHHQLSRCLAACSLSYFRLCEMSSGPKTNPVSGMWKTFPTSDATHYLLYYETENIR